MSKNPNSRSKPVKETESMNGAMKFFLAGCVAELYLLLIRRFYINGSAEQAIAWHDHYLKYLLGAGAVVLVVGLVMAFLCKASKPKQTIGWWVTGAGAFLAVSTGMVMALNASAVNLLSVVVPVAMLLGILWTLYDRECALSLSILGTTLIVLWICKKIIASSTMGIYVKIGAVVYLVLMCAIAYLLRQGKLSKLLPAESDELPIYAACGLSVIGVLLAFISNPMITYYTMWTLAIVVFALAVYYTVKQL